MQPVSDPIIPDFVARLQRVDTYAEIDAVDRSRKVVQGEMVALHAPPANAQAEVFGADARYFNPRRETPKGMQPWGMTFGLGVHSCLGRNLVTGIMNRGDDKHGTHGTAVRIMMALYGHGGELDPANPPKRPADSMHDTFESLPMILRGR